MNPRLKSIITIAGFLAILFGIAIDLYLSSMMTWGEMEAALIANPNSEGSLDLNCPLALASWETGIISGTVTNTVDESVTPMLQAVFSHGDGNATRISREILDLAPQETASFEYKVDSTDARFDRFILASVLQRPYRKLLSRHGTCSILLLDVYGLSGKQSLSLLIALGLAIPIAASGFMLYSHIPLRGSKKSLVVALGLVVAMASFGLLSAIYRLWGLTILFDVIFALGVVSILTEIRVVGKDE